MHHDPKPKDSDSEDDATVERKKPEGSWFPPQREKGLDTSEVSSVHVRVQYKYALFMKVNVTSDSEMSESSHFQINFNY